MVKRDFLLNGVFAIAIGFHVCTSFCYHPTQIAEIFYILQLFLICHNLYWGWFPVSACIG
jgi:hypothetical protein